MDERRWHALGAEEVVHLVQGARTGLSAGEVQKRQRAYGKNVLPEPDRVSPMQIFLRQFFSPLVALLAVAAGVSFFLGDVLDVVSIALVLFINAFLGFFQEYRADQRMRVLRAMVGVRATVERAGELIEIPAEELVVGDVLYLRAGMRVGADARILEANDLATHEAALTGESTEVEKQVGVLSLDVQVFARANMVFLGTSIARGMGKAVVVAIGAQTVFAGIAHEAQQTTGRESGFAKELKNTGRALSIAVLLLAGALFLLGIYRGEEAWHMLYVSIALAVAAIPEGMLIATTVALAAALQRMARERVLVRALSVPERLSAVQMLCVDKTGTLTEGKMEVRVVDTSRSDRTLFALSAFTEQSRKHPSLALSLTEHALGHYVRQQGVQDVVVVSRVPFSSRTKYSEVVISLSEGDVVFRLGAPEVLLPALQESNGVRSLRERAEAMTRRGLRVLMLVEQGHFLAFLGIADPLRTDAREMVVRLQEQGVRLLMLTGDHIETAQAIASDVGIVGEAVQGSALQALSDAELARRLRGIGVIARMVPQDKLRIVRALQADGVVVGMTGDGVNDSPALAAADVGIALQSGTDVAREVADMVLMDDRLSTISHALEEGRGTFLALQRIAAYLLMLSLGEMAVFAFALLFGSPLPLSPVQVLWLNIIADGIPALGLAAFLSYDPQEVLAPRSKLHGIFSPSLKRFLGIAVAILVLPFCALLFFTASFAQEQVAGIFFIAFVFDALVTLWLFAHLRTFQTGLFFFGISLFALGASLLPFFFFPQDMTAPSLGIVFFLFVISLGKSVLLWMVWRVILVRRPTFSPALVS